MYFSFILPHSILCPFYSTLSIYLDDIIANTCIQTPPLEWIGLHRDRLPNLTHQIVIVTLLELASEVEDAYTRILGTS